MNYDYSFNKPIKLNNEEIIKNFTILRDYVKELKQQFKYFSYQKAIDKIRELEYDITLQNIKTTKVAGKKLTDKIIEFLQTGSMKA